MNISFDFDEAVTYSHVLSHILTYFYLSVRFSEVVYLCRGVQIV